MLNVPQLDDLSFEKLFERARSRIPAMSTEWTDFNAHDPGITTLQTYAWLTDTLNYYMNATGDAHRMKYFKLLGIQPHEAAAECTVALESNKPYYTVPRGTRMRAGDVVFECTQTVTGATNRVKKLYRQCGQRMLDITHLAGEDGSYAELFSYDGDNPQLYIGFEQPFAGNVRFYVEVRQDPRRNAFADDFQLVGLEWEYYDGTRWQKANLVKDDTCGFLRCGFVQLEVPGSSGVMENPLVEAAHYLRCTLVENQFDQLPALGHISPCCLQARQTQTLAQALVYTYGEKTYIDIDYYIREDDVITVAVEDGDGYVTWFEHVRTDESLCDVIPGKYPWQRTVDFSGRQFGRVPARGQKVLVMITPAELYGQMVAGQCRGCAEERIPLEWDGLIELELALATRENGRVKYQLWHPCEDIGQAGYADPVFTYDERTHQICFGDGIHGMQPPEGAIVMVVTAKCTTFEQGNIRRGQLNQLMDPMEDGLTIINLEDAHGGQYCATQEQLEQLLADKLSRVSRAVTQQDYQQIVLHTPGLMIDYVNVIPSKEYAACWGTRPQPNTVILAVKPHTHEPHAVLTRRMLDILQSNLEKYRLLTTKIEIVSPHYVGVQVFGRIALKENTKKAREDVRRCITESIDFNHTGGFGKDIAYGSVFSQLELLDGVKNVIELSLEPMGRGGDKNGRGDIILCPDALAYVRSVDIEFL